jgi:ABC-type branched-subunit amino acid transport system substrate-binding protein
MFFFSTSGTRGDVEVNPKWHFLAVAHRQICCMFRWNEDAESALVILKKRFFLRPYGRFAALAGLALALNGCIASNLPGFGTSSPPPPPAATQTSAPASGPTIGAGSVKVGLILPLSAGGQGAIVANALRNAAEMALAEFQGADLTLLVKDDRGTAEGAQAAAQAALSEGAELIIGPLFAPTVQAAGQVARAANRPVIAFSTDTSVAARGVYLLSFLAENDVDRIVSHAISQGRRSFTALVPDTAYGKVVEAAFQQSAGSRGARVVAIERYQQDAVKIREAVGRLGPALAQSDAILLPDGADYLLPISQALQATGFDPKKVKPLGTGVWNDARTFAIPQLQGGWFASPDAAGFNAFSARYQKRFNTPPTRTATLAYDAVSLVAALARTQGTQRFSEAVLTNQSGFAGADGVFRFRADGPNDRGLAVLEIRTNSSVTVSPSPRELGQRRSGT